MNETSMNEVEYMRGHVPLEEAVSSPESWAKYEQLQTLKYFNGGMGQDEFLAFAENLPRRHREYWSQRVAIRNMRPEENPYLSQDEINSRYERRQEDVLILNDKYSDVVFWSGNND